MVFNLDRPRTLHHCLTPHMDQHVLQRLHRTFLFLVSASSAIVRSSLSICRGHALHCSQRLSFRCFTKANMSASRNSSQHSNFGESSTTARTSSVWKIAAHTRTGHKFSTADAAANERTVYGVGTNCCMENRKSRGLVRCFFDPIVRRLPFDVMRLH
jgi:hypothetical protein